MAALASVMLYYRDSAGASEASAEQQPRASREGYSLGELRDFAKAHGYAAFVVPGDMAFLRSHLARGRPVIVPLHLPGNVPVLSRAMGTRYDHYVVVVGVDDARGKVITMDPARGPAELDFDEFAAAWDPMNRAALLLGSAQGG
jgi:hypothetical protein